MSDDESPRTFHEAAQDLRDALDGFGRALLPPRTLAALRARLAAFNAALAARLTGAVSTMAAAYAFAALALLGFPGLHAPLQQLIAWLSQTFIQLTMLAVLAVGQRLQGERTGDGLADVHARHDTHDDMLASIHELVTALHGRFDAAGAPQPHETAASAPALDAGTPAPEEAPPAL